MNFKIIFTSVLWIFIIMVSGTCAACGHNRHYFNLESHYQRSHSNQPPPVAALPFLHEEIQLPVGVDAVNGIPGDAVNAGIPHNAVDAPHFGNDDIYNEEDNQNNDFEYDGFEDVLDDVNINQPPILLRHNGSIPYSLEQHHLEHPQCRQSISTLDGVLDPEERSMMYIEIQATLLREDYDIHQFSDIADGTLLSLFNTIHRNKASKEASQNQNDVDKKFVSELYAFLDVTTLSIIESDHLIKLIKKRPGNDCESGWRTRPWRALVACFTWNPTAGPFNLYKAASFFQNLS